MLREIEMQVHPLLLGRDLHVLAHLAHQLIQADRPDVARAEARVLAAEEQELGDESGQPLHLLEQVLEHLAVAFGRSRRAEGDLGLGPHRGQRGAQLVGGVGGESPDLLEGALESFDHCVEGTGQAAQLVLGASLFAGGGPAGWR